MAFWPLPAGWELFAVLAVVLLLFGPTQLPKLAKMFGKSAKALKEGLDEGMKETDEDADTDTSKKSSDASKKSDASKPGE